MFEEPTAWDPRGRVAVTGTATLVGPNLLRVEGCAVRAICRNKV